MDLSRLRRGEIAAAIGGIVLVISLFLPAYSPNTANPDASVAGGRSDASIWQTDTVIRFVLLVAALAPFVLLLIVARNQRLLNWPRGELTALLGLVATALLLYLGVIDRPGNPPGEIGLTVGWFIALLSAIAITIGGALRSTEAGRRRKPPGMP